MNAVDFSEVERKYDVDAASVLPPLHELPGVTWVDAPVDQSLDAVYFDTADLTLAAHRITLRRRTGGDDAGWHLKLPSGVDGRGPDERREVHEPLGSDPELVPAGLQQRVRVLVRDRVLVPVVRLRNHRIVHVLRGDNGAVLAEVCDDSVLADRLGVDPLRQEWREWEIELVDGAPELLDAVAEAFAAGESVAQATPRSSAVPSATAFPQPRRPHRRRRPGRVRRGPCCSPTSTPRCGYSSTRTRS
ncbi:CYTH domain-containing protein [Cryobacterium sp. 10C3]|uniref:CYTH domain-containing protein n=1 Tax=Cryobacterium sp. 10C3 TaxID=3048577 RepID=UPI002AB4ABA2|nr:CYTH domain-containing protein [Cryobacterium sp. 10C3]MDY7557257.1 CYTH domain-containing protein [Cryobacterium sp. 10C3]